jgi:transposase-like protein
VSVESPGKIEAAIVHLTPCKPNAVRAAFKAGVKPSQIARQFGLSQSDVRKALASDASRRAPDGHHPITPRLQCGIRSTSG